VLFKQALAGSPSNGTAIFGLAEAYRGSGQTALALKSYRRYVRSLPFGPDAGSARFQIQSLQGKRR
jgi:Tfp pilus assembly protein PilF